MTIWKIWMFLIILDASHGQGWHWIRCPFAQTTSNGSIYVFVDAGMVILVFFFVFSFILDPVELQELYR